MDIGVGCCLQCLCNTCVSCSSASLTSLIQVVCDSKALSKRSTTFNSSRGATQHVFSSVNFASAYVRWLRLSRRVGMCRVSTRLRDSACMPRARSTVMNHHGKEADVTFISQIAIQQLDPRLPASYSTP